MAPIHDTDVAEERWMKSEWENFELWEKVEVRIRRKKRFWIFATVVVFLFLSAIPIMLDRLPKWRARRIARHLAIEINRIKIEAGLSRAAYRLKLVDEGNLKYIVEKVPSCASPQGQIIRSGFLAGGYSRDPHSYTWIPQNRAQELGVPGMVNDFCYDYLLGNSAATHDSSVIGFGFLPVNDLAVSRLDRLSILLLTGPSAEISFD